jgi:mono/diheme cytochrome c family protein
MKAIIVVVAIIFLFLIFLGCGQNSGKQVSETTERSSRIERGRYLVETVANCMHCHSQRDFTKFSGPLVEETKGMGGVAYPKFGTLYSSNITPDPATGIGAWTDDEIAKAITQGIARNGDTLYPIMPYYEYNKMCPEDVYSMVAYLRTLKPIVNAVPQRKLNAPAGPEHQLYTYVPIEKNNLPLPADTIETGKYIATISACVSCHTPKTEEDHFIADQFYAGGDRMGKKFGFTVSSPNITPDSVTGIGGWSEQAFINKFESFRDPAVYSHDPGKHNTIMPWTMLSQMKEEDLKAVYAYLRTVKPVYNKVEKWEN